MRTILLLFIAFGVAVGVSTPAQALSEPTLHATHPTIAAETTAAARQIKDIGVRGDRLYLGYGDYTANTGPTDIAWVTTSGVTGSDLTVPTEEINTYRAFRGHLFAPWIDPTGCGTCTPSNGGYSTSDANAWHNVHVAPAGHVYDYTELGTSRFLAGAIAYGGAGVWQSDNGGPWRLVLSEESAGGATGWERFYWIITLNGKVYAQARHNGGTTAAPSSDTFRMKVWDGARWKSTRANVPGISEAHQIEVFKGRAYFRTGVFTGTRTVSHNAPVSFPRDWFATDDWLYVLGSDGRVARTSNGTQWESLGTVNTNARSIAVVGSTVYIGTNNATVYRSTL
jgi:hypothetical protein